MQRWTPEHAKFVGRVIFANFLNLSLENYKSIIEEVESLPVFKQLSGVGSGRRRNRAAIIVRHLSRAKTLNDENKNRSSTVVAKIEQRGKRFTIRYAYKGFNKMYVIDKRVGKTLGADSDIRSTLFRLRRISSRNALTHELLRGIIEYQRGFLRTGNPIDLVPFSQIQLTKELPIAGNEKSQIEKSKICNSWTSRLVNRLSVIIPSGEDKSLKSFFQTQKDINKRLIKQILDQENDDLQSGKLKRPYTDNELRTMLEALLREKHSERITDRYDENLNANSVSRWTVGHCRKDMGIPPAKRRLSGYKYPPLSANFSMLYSLILEEVLRSAPSSPGIYEFRLKGKEIEHPNGKTQVIYIGSTKNIRKRLREHLGKNSKNGHIRDFLKNHDCSFRYIQFSTPHFREKERELYKLFVVTYGSPPRCNRVKP